MKFIIYRTALGKAPFLSWEDRLERSVRMIIRTRLDRLKEGNLGDWKVLKGAEGVCEMRINYGPGYRVYFGKEGSMIVILLLGGDKGSQDKDIEKARQYWLDYKEHKNDY